MDDKFLYGLALGVIGGAMIVANSVKARQFVVEGQEQIKNSVEKIAKNQKNKK